MGNPRILFLVVVNSCDMPLARICRPRATEDFATPGGLGFSCKFLFFFGLQRLIRAKILILLEADPKILILGRLHIVRS